MSEEHKISNGIPAGGVFWQEPAEGLILVQGPDALKFLDGLVTNDLQRVGVGQAQANFLCGSKGAIMHQLVVARLDEALYVLLPQPGTNPQLGKKGMAGHLEAFHVREEVQMGQAPLVRVELLGDGAAKALEHLGLPVEGGRALLPEAFGGQAVRVFPLPLGAVPRWILLGQQEEPLREALQANGVAAWEAVDYDDISLWALAPRIGREFVTDVVAKAFPGEVSLYDHIAFNQGCYVGQEVHARMHYRGHPNRKLVAVKAEQALEQALPVGQEALLEGLPEALATALEGKTLKGTPASWAPVVGGEQRGMAWVPYPLGLACAKAPNGLPLQLGGQAVVLQPLPAESAGR